MDQKSAESHNDTAQLAPLELFWDATFAIVVTLMEEHPNLDPQAVGLLELAEIVETLPGFCDDPDLANEQILVDIQSLWYEETHQ